MLRTLFGVLTGLVILGGLGMLFRPQLEPIVMRMSSEGKVISLLLLVLLMVELDRYVGTKKKKKKDDD